MLRGDEDRLGQKGANPFAFPRTDSSVERRQSWGYAPLSWKTPLTSLGWCFAVCNALEFQPPRVQRTLVRHASLRAPPGNILSCSIDGFYFLSSFPQFLLWVGCAANPSWFLRERGGFYLLADLPQVFVPLGRFSASRQGLSSAGKPP